MKEIFVTKRDGRTEELDYDKINNVLISATEKISSVSASDIAMNAKLQIYDKMSTEEIHKVLIQSAAELISEKTPNYQFVASNLTNYLIRKNIFGSETNLPHLFDLINKNINLGVYDSKLLEYSYEEIGKLNGYIKHQRDYEFTYSGIQQLIDKYLLKDRRNGSLYETPQYMYMCIAMTLFADSNNRIEKVKSFYDDISKFKINLPTPILAGVRTPNRQWSSCTLIETGDSLDSIYSTNTAIGAYTAKRAGIGINAGRIRAIGDSIRGGEVIHTGVIPFLKMYESTVKSCTQNGIRGGSATVYVPFWHKEIKDILVLKNNKGTDDNRVRKLDYAVQFCRLFYKRFIDKQDISLFSPGDVPDLYDAFGNNDLFESLYEKYEKDKKINKTKISAIELMNSFCQERIGTGRMYVMNIDHANSHGAFLDPIRMSNLCLSGDSMINNVFINDTFYDAINMLELIDHYNNHCEIKVMSKNIVTKQYEYKKLLKAWMTKENAEMYALVDSKNNILKTTGCHLIYSNEKWTETRNIQSDEVLDSINYETTSVYKVIKLDKNENVYDLTIEGNHNFYANNILVHNCTEINLPVSPLNHQDDGIIVKHPVVFYNEEDFKTHLKTNDLYLFAQKDKYAYTYSSKNNLYKIVDPLYVVQEGETLEYHDVELVYGESPAEIALCVLSAINVGVIKDYKELEGVCDNVVRALDAIIDLQDYPMHAARKMLSRRSIGVGITNLAYFLAKNDLTYDDPKSLPMIDELMEHIQYFLIKASVGLAKEKGPCKFFNRTKYSKGILPIDTYNKNVDKLVQRSYSLDWESLRADIMQYGMRNSTLSAVMPCESSSVSSNSTNGMEPVRATMISKKSKQGILKSLLPDISKLKNKYQLAFDLNGNRGIIAIQSVIQKWIDQGISANHYYDFTKYPDNEIPLSEIVKDILYFYQMGGKQIYYSNTYDGKTDDFEEMLKDKVEDCEGGACSV